VEKFQKPHGLNWLINVSVAGFHHRFYKKTEFFDHLRNLKTPSPDIRNYYQYLILAFLFAPGKFLLLFLTSCMDNSCDVA
jgi:hypothetical protein